LARYEKINEEYVKCCNICQKNKIAQIKTKLPLQVMTAPDVHVVWEKCSLDIVVPLTTTADEKKYLLTFQDDLQYIYAVNETILFILTRHYMFRPLVVIFRCHYSHIRLSNCNAHIYIRLHISLVSDSLGDMNIYSIDGLKLKLSASQHMPSLWLRYVDDTFVVWPHGPDRLHNFPNHLNSSVHNGNRVKQRNPLSGCSGHQKRDDTCHQSL
jgi:hypothetical protein